MVNLFLFSISVFAAQPPTETTTNTDLSELAQQFEKSRDNLVQSESHKRQILGAIFQINDKVKRMSRRKEQITYEMLGAKHQVEQLTTSIQNLEENTDRQRQRIRQSIRTIYQFSGRGMVSSVFSQMTGPDLDRFLKYLKVLSEHDAKLLKNYKSDIQHLKVTRKRLSRESKRLSNLKIRLRRQEENLRNEHNNQKSILSQIDKNQLLQKVKLTELRSASHQLSENKASIDKALLKMLQPSFFESRGQLLPPVLNATLTEKSGFINYPKYDLQMSHKGVFFKTSPKTSVQCVADGIVKEALVVEGYGHVAIVDHGHHYYTVYGNQESMTVKIGDSVQKGQVIGTVGNKGFWNQVGVYFEVRHFAEPEDPLTWIKSDQFKMARGLDLIH